MQECTRFISTLQWIQVLVNLQHGVVHSAGIFCAHTEQSVRADSFQCAGCRV